MYYYEGQRDEMRRAIMSSMESFIKIPKIYTKYEIF